MVAAELVAFVPVAASSDIQPAVAVIAVVEEAVVVVAAVVVAAAVGFDIELAAAELAVAELAAAELVVVVILRIGRWKVEAEEAWEVLLVIWHYFVELRCERELRLGSL